MSFPRSKIRALFKELPGLDVYCPDDIWYFEFKLVTPELLEESCPEIEWRGKDVGHGTIAITDKKGNRLVYVGKRFVMPVYRDKKAPWYTMRRWRNYPSRWEYFPETIQEALARLGNTEDRNNGFLIVSIPVPDTSSEHSITIYKTPRDPQVEGRDDLVTWMEKQEKEELRELRRAR